MSCLPVSISLPCPCSSLSIDLSKYFFNPCLQTISYNASADTGTVVVTNNFLSWTAGQIVPTSFNINVATGNGSISRQFIVTRAPVSLSTTPVSANILCPYTSCDVDIFAHVSDGCGHPVSLVVSNVSSGTVSVLNGIASWTGTSFSGQVVKFTYTVFSSSRASIDGLVILTAIPAQIIAPDLVKTVPCPGNTFDLNLFEGTSSSCLTNTSVDIVQPDTGTVVFDKTTGAATWSSHGAFLTSTSFKTIFSTGSNSVNRTITLNCIRPAIVGLQNLSANLTATGNTSTSFTIAPVDACGQTLVVTAACPSKYGTVTVNGTTLVYTYTGSASFDTTFPYTVTSADSRTATGTIEIKMVAPAVAKQNFMLVVDNRSTLTTNDSVYGYGNGTALATVKSVVHRTIDLCTTDSLIGLVYGYNETGVALTPFPLAAATAIRKTAMGSNIDLMQGKGTDYVGLYNGLNYSYNQMINAKTGGFILVITELPVSSNDIITLATKIKSDKLGIKIVVFLIRKNITTPIRVGSNVAASQYTLYTSTGGDSYSSTQVTLGNGNVYDLSNNVIGYYSGTDGGYNYYTDAYSSGLPAGYISGSSTTTTFVSSIHTSLDNKSPQWMGQQIASPNLFFHCQPPATGTDNVDPVAEIGTILQTVV